LLKLLREGGDERVFKIYLKQEIEKEGSAIRFLHGRNFGTGGLRDGKREKGLVLSGTGRDTRRILLCGMARRGSGPKI